MLKSWRNCDKHSFESNMVSWFSWSAWKSILLAHIYGPIYFWSLSLKELAASAKMEHSIQELKSKRLFFLYKNKYRLVFYLKKSQFFLQNVLIKVERIRADNMLITNS